MIKINTENLFDLILATVQVAIKSVPKKEQAKFTNRLIDEIGDFYDQIRTHKRL